jgi:ribonuclease HII
LFFLIFHSHHCIFISGYQKLKRIHLQHELDVGYPSLVLVGADEVGRGCLAGPVVAAAVALPSEIDFEVHPWLFEIDDSKKVKPAVRDRLAPLIAEWALASAVGVASVEEIDEINIFHASHLAIVRAIEGLKLKARQRIGHILIDGKFLPKQKMPAPASAVIQGDAKCLSIAAASIIAKVWRDQYMLAQEIAFPGYGFAQHKGYPTAAHTLALKKQGVTVIHRRSFGTVASLL